MPEDCRIDRPTDIFFHWKKSGLVQNGNHRLMFLALCLIGCGDKVIGQLGFITPQQCIGILLCFFIHLAEFGHDQPEDRIAHTCNEGFELFRIQFKIDRREAVFLLRKDLKYLRGKTWDQLGGETEFLGNFTGSSLHSGHHRHDRS